MVYGEEASRNTHRVFKVNAKGTRTFMHSGSAESASQAAHAFAQMPKHAGSQMIVEPHSGKDPK